jgi:class 3 adenylate cyclase
MEGAGTEPAQDFNRPALSGSGEAPATVLNLDRLGAGRNHGRMARELTGGVVTLLFTDIEGSTRLLHELGDRYDGALEKVMVVFEQLPAT